MLMAVMSPLLNLYRTVISVFTIGIILNKSDIPSTPLTPKLWSADRGGGGQYLSKGSARIFQGPNNLYDFAARFSPPALILYYYYYYYYCD
jgi:hypothetical protein